MLNQSFDWFLYDRNIDPNGLIWQIKNYRNSRPDVFSKKGFLKISQNSEENTCARVSFFNNVSFEFCEISRNTFIYRTPPVAASEIS